jgi:hypothetical protein
LLRKRSTVPPAANFALLAQSELSTTKALSLRNTRFPVRKSGDLLMRRCAASLYKIKVRSGECFYDLSPWLSTAICF